MTLRSKLRLRRYLKDFLVSSAIFAIVAVITFADASAEAIFAGVDPLTGTGSPWLVAGLGMVFSAMLAFGFAVARHLVGAVTKARVKSRLR